MNVGDLVIINVPMGAADTTPDAVQGMIVDKRVIGIDVDKEYNTTDRIWWYVLRSDTGTIESFHEDWIKAGENGNW